MKSTIAALTLGICLAATAGADIDYEGAGSGHVPDGYAGMNWSSDHYSLISDSGGYGDMGTQVGFNAFAASPISFWSEDNSKFDVGEVRASTAWRDWVDLEFRGMNNGSIVYSVVIRLARPTVHTLNFTDIDEIQIHYVADSGNNFYQGGDGTHIVLDDWTLVTGPPSYSLNVSGTCPGELTIQWNNAPPNVLQAVIFGLNIGETTLPNGIPCEGTVLNLSGNVHKVGSSFINTGDGSGSVIGNAGSAAACGAYLQLIEGDTCTTSNVAQIPQSNLEYTLIVTGSCRSQLTIEWEDASPNTLQALVFGFRKGTSEVPPGSPCAGTTLLLEGNVQVVGGGPFSTGNGSGSVSGRTSRFACEAYLQLIQGRLCNTSNAAQIPN